MHSGNHQRQRTLQISGQMNKTGRERFNEDVDEETKSIRQ